MTLPHVDPVTGETARTSRTVDAKTKKGAEKARGALIFGLGSDGGAVGSSMTVREFMEQFPRYKEASGTIEPSTVRSYRGELPGARERLDDARHLRRRGPTRSYSYLLFPQGKSSAPPQPAGSPRAMTEPCLLYLVEVIVLGGIGSTGAMPVEDLLVGERSERRPRHLGAAPQILRELLHRHVAPAVRVLHGSELDWQPLFGQFFQRLRPVFLNSTGLT